MSGHPLRRKSQQARALQRHESFRCRPCGNSRGSGEKSGFPAHRASPLVGAGLQNQLSEFSGFFPPENLSMDFCRGRACQPSWMGCFLHGNGFSHPGHRFGESAANTPRGLGKKLRHFLHDRDKGARRRNAGPTAPHGLRAAICGIVDYTTRVGITIPARGLPPTVRRETSIPDGPWIGNWACYCSE